MNGYIDVVCYVMLIRMADTLNISFTNYLYCTIVVTDLLLKYLLEYITAFFVNCQPALDVALSSWLRFD